MIFKTYFWLKKSVNTQPDSDQTAAQDLENTKCSSAQWMQHSEKKLFND